MSFSSDVKKELASVQSDDVRSLHAELYAMLLLSKVFSPAGIVFKTENESTFSRFVDLVTSLFSAVTELRYPGGGKSTKNKDYTVSVVTPQDCRKIFDFYGENEREVTRRVNRANIEDEEAQRAFIRGAFLACGSVTNPEKGYHLEFSVAYRNLCMDVCRIIREIQDCDISVKMLSRTGSYIAYVKDSEQIIDLLTYMGAWNASMDFMNTKAEKQVRNSANRLANSEFANMEKIAAASANQIKAIKKLKKAGKYHLLPPELKDVAEMRYDFPELSLRDIGERLDPPISRSGVNHRLEKIIRLSEEL